MKTAIRRAKDTVYRYNDAQIRIREATSSEDCSVSHSLLVAITEDCEKYSEAYTSMFDMLWKRVNDFEIIKHVEKSLIVVEHLLLFGDKQFHADMQKPEYYETICQLKRYQFILDDVEIGQKVRDLAENCSKLLDKDGKHWKKERKRAAKHPTFGNKNFQWTTPSSSSEEVKTKKRKKKKKKKKSSDEQTAKTSNEEFKFEEDPFAAVPVALAKPSPVKVKAPTSKKNAVRRTSKPKPKPEPVFDDLLQDFVSTGNGQAGIAADKGGQPSIFDDFLTGPEHDINLPPAKSGFVGWLGEETAADTKVEEEKGNVWVPGGSNLIDISNPLAKPKQGTNTRQKKGQSMAEMANSNSLANVMRPQPVIKPKQPDPWVLKKPDPFAAFVPPSQGRTPVFAPTPQPDPFAPMQNVAPTFPVVTQQKPFDFQQPFGTQQTANDPFKNLGW